MTGVFTRRKERQREEGHVKSGRDGHKLRSIRGFQELQEARKEPYSPRGFRESTALSTL